MEQQTLIVRWIHLKCPHVTYLDLQSNVAPVRLVVGLGCEFSG